MTKKKQPPKKKTRVVEVRYRVRTDAPREDIAYTVANDAALAAEGLRWAGHQAQVAMKPRVEDVRRIRP